MKRLGLAIMLVAAAVIGGGFALEASCLNEFWVFLAAVCASLCVGGAVLVLTLHRGFSRLTWIAGVFLAILASAGLFAVLGVRVIDRCVPRENAGTATLEALA